MTIFLATIVGLVLWLVLWAVNFKAFDGFLFGALIVLGACAAHIVAPYLPGNRGDESPPPGA